MFIFSLIIAFLGEWVKVGMFKALQNKLFYFELSFGQKFIVEISKISILSQLFDLKFDLIKNLKPSI